MHDQIANLMSLIAGSVMTGVGVALVMLGVKLMWGAI